MRQLLQWADEPTPDSTPLDPARYPDYHLPQPRPNLAAYNRLLVGQSAASVSAQVSRWVGAEQSTEGGERR